MTDHQSPASGQPVWSLDGLRLGATLMAPALSGMMAFAIAIGATEARKGFALADAMLMNLLAYAGASQMVAMEAWPREITVAGVAALALIAATAGSRRGGPGPRA